jgi:hypothetical protein
MSRQKVTVVPAPLPATNDTIQLKRDPSLNERVKYLMMNGAYAVVRPFIGAVDNNGAVNGSVIFDRAAAANALQNYAKKQGDEFVANHNWRDLDRALNSSLKSMLIEGQPIDRKSRKLAALAKMNAESAGADQSERQE